jgi:hypothetical protein
LLTLSHWNLTNHSERQGNQLTLIRSSIKVVPEYDKPASSSGACNVPKWSALRVKVFMSMHGGELKSASCLPEVMTIAMMAVQAPMTTTPTRLGSMC